MNLHTLLEFYERDERTGKIISGLEEVYSNKEHTFPSIALNGLVGSVDTFIAAALTPKIEFNQLFVLNDKEEAAYFYENLRNLLPKYDVVFFPDSFKKPGHFEEINKANLLLRTEAVASMIKRTGKKLLVSYPEALLEKVVSAKELGKSSIQIKVGESLDISFITEFLIEYSFEHVDFVFEPGQFSIRGGIVDIFSYSNDYPYRIELFDDEVESIRTFDPNDQLSIKKLRSVNIVPNVQEHYGDEHLVPLTQMFQPKTLIWIKDAAYLRESVEKAESKFAALSKSEKEENADKLFPAEDLESALLQFPRIELSSNSPYKVHLTIDYSIAPPTAFNKNFELLISSLNDNTKKGYLNFLFSDNPKQLERFHHIFEDLKAEVKYVPINRSIHAGFIDKDLKVACFTDHQIFNRYHKYRLRRGYSRGKALLMRTLKELKPGDFVTHIDHGVGVYSGMEKLEMNGHWQEAVRIKYSGGDLLYVNINSLHKLSKYSGKEGTQPRVNKLGSETWQKLKSKTKKKIKELAFDLIKLYAKRKASEGFSFSPDSYLQTELEASFIYEDTPDQSKATEATKADMEALHPMDRLVCGDVGFGKTEIAVRAAFKAVADSKQVAVLVPTTILTLQHYNTFKERLSEFPCTVDYINRFKTAAQKKDTFKRLAAGEIDILIGTHGIVSKKVVFKDLGLLIIDEEQKFGVGVKEKLKNIKVNVDTLTLTATPIPRTMQFSLLGARDLSVINTPPPNRQPVTTEVLTFNPDLIKEAIDFEIYRGGQVFFVHNRVKDIEEIKAVLNTICPEIDIGIAHGQMKDDTLEEVVTGFMNREYDLLLSTNIIESGLDIPNANTIIINNAHWFGLSDLHQLRGRVGRSNKKAFCYLFSPPKSSLTKEARHRLKTIEDFADLGSGFNIAMRDLDIRGAGNLLGAEQSGFISEIGYDMYHKILEETIQDLRENEFRELYKDKIPEHKTYVKDCQIDTDRDVLIPDKYVNNVNERLALYGEINDIKTEEGINQFIEKLKDRFGPVPKPVFALFDSLRLKWIATDLGIERVVLKNAGMKCYFINNPDSPFFQSNTFAQILEFVKSNPAGVSFKPTEKNLILVFAHINGLSQACRRLAQITIRSAEVAEN